MNRLTLVSAFAACLLAAASTACKSSAATPASEATAAPSGAGPAQRLPLGTHIDVFQDGQWSRADVSEDTGPSNATIKVRLQPDNTFMVVPRKSIRLVPHPASINVGDHLEAYDTSVFKYRTGTVTSLGSGDYAAYVMLSDDSHPTAQPSYIKRENLWVLPANAPGNTAAAAPVNPAAGGPTLGEWHCYAYSNPPNPPIFLGYLTLNAGGSYSGKNSGGTDSPGTYTYDAASHTISWSGGWMATNHFAGKLETNALLRISPSSICSKS